MVAAVLNTLRAPHQGQGLHSDTVTLALTTLTPLYTGGIGQWGEQLHPSGILGGIRRFSCLVARTVGDIAFESTVWGNAGQNGSAQAKQVALRLDTSGLRTITLPPRLLFRREDTGRDRGWYYNQAQEGSLTLTLTRRGISDQHWHLLLLALRIQIRHATFGAKDQFGLGVLDADTLPLVTPLDDTLTYTPKGFSLQRCAFGRLRVQKASVRGDDLTLESSLRLGIAGRIALRDALRAPSDADPQTQDIWKTIRHRMMGSLNQYGSAVNISAAYLPDESPTGEIRLFVQLKLDDRDQRTEVMKRFNRALSQIHVDGWNTIPQGWQFGGTSFGGLKHPAKWLNQLAGL